jgi:predicted HTH transcriptional regulator
VQQTPGMPATASRFTAGLSPELQRAYDAFQDKMTHRELGKKLGVSHPTADKYIELLKAKGLIDSQGHKVERSW